MKILTTAVLLGTIALSAVSAETLRQEQWDNQRRIWRGYETGRLTPRETAALEHRQRNLDRQYWRDRYDGGGLSYRERVELQRRQERLDRETRRELWDNNRRW